MLRRLYLGINKKIKYIKKLKIICKNKEDKREQILLRALTDTKYNKNIIKN